MKRVVLAALLLAAAGLAGYTPPARAANATVGILSASFKTGDCPDPAGDSVTTVEVGDSVTWTSCSGAPHNVTSDDGKFPTKSFQDDGDFASQRFQAPGAYPYKCTIHGFGGTIFVEGSPATTTTATTAPPATTPPTSAAPRTTTTTSIKPTTTTADDLDGFFDQAPTSSTTSTTGDPSAPTTRALGTGGDGTSGGVVALLLVGLIGVGTAVALIMRRVRGAAPPI